VIHYSAMPWINFTSVSHARSFSFRDSSPKITFGKMAPQGDSLVMPLSIHVHHALMDASTVAAFITRFQQLMNQDDA
jgi:chloramphenicol O-acetyltransferase type A